MQRLTDWRRWVGRTLMVLPLMTAGPVPGAEPGIEVAAPAAESGLPESTDPSFEDLPALVPGKDLYAGDPEMERLLGILLDENPDILAARRDWLAHRERPRQARTLPDPQVGIRYFVDSIETRVGPQNATVEVTQPVPWLSKLTASGDREDRLAASRRATVRRVERDRVRDFKRAWYDLAYIQEALLVNGEEQSLLQRFEQIALTRYSTGEGIQQNIIKVQTEITRLLDRHTLLSEGRETLLRRLAQLIGRPEVTLEGGEIRLPDPPVEPPGPGLVAEAEQNRPELLSLRERIQADDLQVKRRHLDRRPDFRFGISYTDVGTREDPAGVMSPPPDNGQDALALVAGIRIPMYGGRISAGIREAMESRQADVHRLEGERDRVRYEVQEVSLRLESLLERVALYRDTLIPQAEQSLSSTEAAYETNQLDVLDLLDAERVWFQVRLAHRRLLSDAWIALADLERAVGARIPS